jgi:CDP-diacylglycerol--serine O-phosphatidyltransferase
MMEMLTPHRRASDVPNRRLRRGIYLLPSLMTLGNMFCGYACVIYAMRGEYAIAAPFIGVAMVLDILDGRIARMTGTTSEFGLQFDSPADVISFESPRDSHVLLGLIARQPGWAAGFSDVTAAAMRLARSTFRPARSTSATSWACSSPAAATVPASTIFAYPSGFQEPIGAIPVLALVLVPAFLMVSTIRFRSFKTFDLQARRSYTVLLVVAVLIAFVSAHPALALVTLSYGYMVSAFGEMLAHRIRHRYESHAAPAAANVVEHRPRGETRTESKI